MTKRFIIKESHVDEWGDTWENEITEDELHRLANEWDVSVSDLLEDLEEI